MAQSRDHENPSSPRSSTGGAESFKGTPDTRLTAFSPDGGSAKTSKILQGLAHSPSATPPAGFSVSNFRSGAAHLDPFITPSHQPGTRLSPTASTFSPFPSTGKVPSSNDSEPVAAALSNDLGLSRHLDVSSPASLSVSEVNNWLSASLSTRIDHGVPRTAANLIFVPLQEVEGPGEPPYGTRIFDALHGHVHIYFTDIRDACATYSKIRLAEKGWKVEYADSSRVSEPDVVAGTETVITQAGQIILLAAVPQGVSMDALQAMQTVQRLLASYGRLFAFIKRSTFPNGSFRAIVEFCDVSCIILAVSNCNNLFTPEGIHIIVSTHGPDIAAMSTLADAVQTLSLGKAGDGNDQHLASVSAPATIRPLAAPDIRAHSQFAMYPLVFQSPFATGMPYTLDSFLSANTHTHGQITPVPQISPSYPVIGPLFHSPPSPALTAHHGYSPSRQLAGFGKPDTRRQNAMRISRSSYHNVASHHNHVDINRIRDGIDVRTTVCTCIPGNVYHLIRKIMLRNIPNKVDQAMLKRIIDESSWGKYDFMYLRIDFANDCNVGYAFINFVDPLDIIDFVEARGNQRWNCFKSDKVAEISYATIQGKDCLVQKFRNSSVMLEAPHYRPKVRVPVPVPVLQSWQGRGAKRALAQLYFTSNGPMPQLAGQEEPFPEPDNQSKMKRSCENAEHVGLFTPNAGQHFRDEQRRRRSQYDRGTRLAALEEYDYETAIQQHLYGPAAQQ
ncbi:meiosis protein MEI2 [Drechmeria coniospora]|uniref:Meiosis protein MEI2 n=1 Tax=Drechmeria coniospora TaxID=98403 RepID=A0A151GBW2_DRECN|nr:meiosis protein MEI2 [Drechmeria coniospora]KYK54535.1 meiosis protein MEI2 [Drechmeria coniospora]